MGLAPGAGPCAAEWAGSSEEAVGCGEVASGDDAAAASCVAGFLCGCLGK